MYFLGKLLFGEEESTVEVIFPLNINVEPVKKNIKISRLSGSDSFKKIINIKISRLNEDG